MATYSNAPPGESDRHPGEFIEGVLLEPCGLSIHDGADLLIVATALERGLDTSTGLRFGSARADMASGSTEQHGHLGATEQDQQPLEFAAIVGGGVELEGKSASIKSISDSIQSSNACSFSSYFERFSSSFSRISLAGSRRQLSIRKNERKGELTVGEGDVVIGRKKRDQANNTANDGFQECFAVKPQPPPGERRI